MLPPSTVIAVRDAERAHHRHVELRVELRRVAEHDGDAGLELREVQEAAAVQRQAVDLRPPDDALHAVRFEIDRASPCRSPSPLRCARSPRRHASVVVAPVATSTGLHDRLKSRCDDQDVVGAGSSDGTENVPSQT